MESDKYWHASQALHVLCLSNFFYIHRICVKRPAGLQRGAHHVTEALSRPPGVRARCSRLISSMRSWPPATTW